MKKEEFYNAILLKPDENGKEHVITVVGLYGMVKTLEDVIVQNTEGIFITQAEVNKKYLSLGYSISHPDDEFDEKFGLRLAMKRALNAKENMGIIETEDFRMLSDSMNQTIVDHQAKYIFDNFEKFINKYNK